MNRYARVWKRALDLALSAVALVVLSPVMALAALAVKLDSSGPVIFKQTRLGRGGAPFQMYKFRSMCVGAEKTGTGQYSFKNDPRVTKVGRFLRATSIDELPQLVNILKGDMSLVGTRPPTMDEYKQYELHHKFRLAFKPGITGMWQVSGRSSIKDFEEVVRLDGEYIRNWSILLDIKIILKTIKVVLSHAGAE